MWESRNLYSYNFVKFFFLDSFFNKLLIKGVFNHFGLINKNIFKHFDKTSSFKYFNSNFNITENKTATSFNVFNSKLWLLSYQN